MLSRYLVGGGEVRWGWEWVLEDGWDGKGGIRFNEIVCCQIPLGSNFVYIKEGDRSKLDVSKCASTK